MVVQTEFAVSKFLKRVVCPSATLAVFGVGAIPKMSRELSFFRQLRGRRVCAPLLLLSGLLVPSTLLFAKTVTLSATDNNTSICLVEGDSLVVTLPSPIPNAPGWKLQMQQPSPLTSVREFETPASGKTRQAQTFRFNAASAGKTTLILAFHIGGLDSAQQANQVFSVEVAIASGVPKSLVLVGTYKGTTACADCTGILTVLRLYAKGPNDFTSNVYITTRTYEGGRNGDQSFTDRGEWYLNKGDAVDPNATVYALSPDDPALRKYFVQQPGGATLTELDGQMKPIDAPPQYQSILKRVE
jgi:predicted secreted protein